MNADHGITDHAMNPFARKDWIDQHHQFTQHRHEQVEQLFGKTVDEIKRVGNNKGRYPAFVAIRWRLAEMKNGKLVPKVKWAEWVP